jgi:hypothetical protein
MGKVVNLDEHTQFKPKASKKKKKKKHAGPGRPVEYFSRSQLLEHASVDFSKATNNKDMFREALKAVVDLIPVAQGLCKIKPSQSSAYAVTKLISQMQELVVKIEGLIDYKKLADETFEAVFIPFLERHIKSLGRIIKEDQEKVYGLVSEKKQRKVKRIMDGLYKRYGKQLESEMGQVRERFVKELTKRTK